MPGTVQKAATLLMKTMRRVECPDGFFWALCSSVQILSMAWAENAAVR